MYNILTYPKQRGPVEVSSKGSLPRKKVMHKVDRVAERASLGK